MRRAGFLSPTASTRSTAKPKLRPLPAPRPAGRLTGEEYLWNEAPIPRPSYGQVLIRNLWFRHPNYLIVFGELAILPLAFNAFAIAVAFSLCNAVLLLRRIRIERAALTFPTQPCGAELIH